MKNKMKKIAEKRNDEGERKKEKGVENNEQYTIVMDGMEWLENVAYFTFLLIIQNSSIGM